jgi:amidase
MTSQPVTSQQADSTDLSATATATGVRSKKLNPEAVLRAHLDRIKLLDDQIGAFQLVRSKQAMDEAHQLNRRPDLAKLPLAGVPVAVKDDIHVAGEPTRYGSAATSTKAAQQDDELVRRLRQAGCIIIGKTKMPELAIWPFTESPTFGNTHNPWDVSHTPGGSSGGSAAAVIAHMVPLALASDGGGSIRVPAACCGIAGLKPGPGIIPRPNGPGKGWMGMTEFGPLARTIEDLRLMFDVLRGNTSPANTRKTPLRIAVSLQSPTPGAKVNAEVRQTISQLADLLADTGHQVGPANPPNPKNLGLRFGSRWLTGIMQDAQNLPAELLEPRTRAMARAGKRIARLGGQKPAVDDKLGQHMRQWFAHENYDVLLMPTLTAPAAKSGKWHGKGWVATTLGVGNWLMTSPWNLARFPAASIPAGMSREGLPIGAQLVAVPGNEDKLLALMEQIQHLKPWPLAVPKTAV